MNEPSSVEQAVGTGLRESQAPEQRAFQEEIDRLAVGASAEFKKAAPGAGSRSRRRFSALVWTGVGLILAEVALFLVQVRVSHRQAPAPGTPIASLMIAGNDCRAELYTTYRGIVRYERANGRPPKALGELVGGYLDRLPADPKTGQGLVYASDGLRFSLLCP